MSVVLRSSFLLLLFSLLAGGSAQAQDADRGRKLPAQFLTNRIYVHPVTTDEDTLHLYTDTGGGRNFLMESTVDRLDLSIEDTVSIGRHPVPVVRSPDFQPDASIPFGESNDSSSDESFPVRPANMEAKMIGMQDGLLGNDWFGGKVWTIDYKEETLVFHPSAEGLSFNPDHTVSLGFKTDSTGQRVNHFPSVEAIIDGEEHVFLFDTGATLALTDTAHSHFEGPVRRGTSFIAASVFERWRDEHPDWRVIEGAGRFGGGTPIIEVPEVTIAGYTVGPVWFAKRPDRNFHQRMSSLMDRQVDGALGGSLFQYFAITIDYPRARAAFLRVE